MQNTRRPSSPLPRPAAAMGEMLENRRLLAGHGPMWDGGEPMHAEAGEYMPMRQNSEAMAGWGLGRMNFLLVIATQMANAADAAASTSSADAASSGSAAIATSQAATSNTAVSGTRFSTALAAAVATRSTSADAVQPVAIADAVPTTPASQNTGTSGKAADDVVAAKDVARDVAKDVAKDTARDIMVPVKIVTVPPVASATVATGPTLKYETARRSLFSQEQIPAQSRRAIETTEAQSEEPVIIADAKGEQVIAAASIAPISIDPLAQPMWQRVAAMSAAGLLVVSNIVLRRRARRLAMLGQR